MTSTPYTRGAAAMREAAARFCDGLAAHLESESGFELEAARYRLAARRIRALALPEEDAK